jgi:hypothetical protein
VGISTRERHEPTEQSDGRRWWGSGLGARIDALLDDGDRWRKKGLLAFVPAAVVAWFGFAVVDFRILAAAGVLAAGGYWHVRRHLGEEVPEDDGDF